MNDLYVDKASALTDLCTCLRASPWITLDTEFIREKTFYPQLCLIQVAKPDLVACIDPLALDDLEPLLEILYDPAITKVLHSAYQDLEIFFHLGARVPAPVFDTQLAATLLGQGEYVGYATLVRASLGVELDKSQTRTDWSHRPLDAAQLAYAGDDVRYLRDVYRLQLMELQNRDRLHWLADDFKELCNPARYQVNLQDAWRRIKASRQFRGVQLAVLQALAAWREKQASTTNRPRKWILSDDTLLALARQMPKDLQRFKRMRGADAATLKQHGQALLQLIATACQKPQQCWPSQPLPQRPSVAQEALVDVMQAVVRLRGVEKSVSPQILATRKDLERLVVQQADIPLLHGWRAALAGHDVQALLQGELYLRVRDGELCLIKEGSKFED